MPGRIKRSAALFKSSWAVLKTHRSLLLLPIISSLATLQTPKERCGLASADTH